MEYRTLETKRLTLRKFVEDDIDFVYNHFTDSFVSKYLYDNEPPKSISQAKEILDWCMDLKSNHIRWCMILKQKNVAIGTIGFHRYDQNNNSAEIGYDLSEPFTQMGLMSEALKNIVVFGIKNYNLHRIYASVATENTASNRLLEKSEFYLEGVVRDQYFFRGKYYDHNLWSYIASE